MDNILEKLLANVGSSKDQIPTEGRARAAYDCYNAIRLKGMHIAKEGYPKATWYKHIKYLGSIGLVAADFQSINVVPLLRRQILLDQPVSSWDEIKLAQRA